MRYLDPSRLAAIDHAALARVRPFPWQGISKQSTPQGYRELFANMPPLELFERKFGYRRRAGQASCDRYSLEYTPDTPVPPWQEFIAELRGEDYSKQIMRIFGCGRPIDCPEDRLQRIFIVLMIPDTLYWRVRDRLVGKQVPL